jgi:hypothetical protein
MTFPNPLAADDPLDAATLNPIFNALYAGEATNAPITATFYPDEAIVLNGNAVALTLDGSIFQTYGRQNPSAINDELQYGAFLPSGTYTLTVRAIKTSASGILKISIDSVLVATFDLYAAADALVALQQTDIAIATSGWKAIECLVDSKNASSSGYDAKILKIYLQRASA